MNLATKTLVLFIAVSLCTAGAVVTVKERAKDIPRKPKVLPINNRAKPDRIWLWS
jgi:hypothetical protein